ncbi:hypothetical protein ACWD5R_42555 [Streptomyces sp. NPDC002514]|uniref:hypothetical protein n=1 Tax=unclassified Streptomyces TaxID=2593676 RepID=UPI0036CDDBB3
MLLASIVISLLAASSAPTPLYARHAAAWHFSPIITTGVFGVYAIAVLLSLLVFGRVSDHIGRRPVLATPHQDSYVRPFRLSRRPPPPLGALQRVTSSPSRIVDRAGPAQLPGASP